MKKLILGFKKAQTEIGQLTETVQQGTVQETLLFLAKKGENDRELLLGLSLIMNSIFYDKRYVDVVAHLDNVFSGRLENIEHPISEIARV